MHPISVSPIPPRESRRSSASRERPPGFPRPVNWPSVEGWLPVADEALRVAHAAHCGAMALKDRPLHRDAARFLARRAEMLAHLIDSLAMDSRCEDDLHQMTEDEVLAGLSEAEERLSAKVRSFLSSRGLKQQVVKLLEQECILSQASRAQIKLAQMEQKAAAPVAV